MTFDIFFRLVVLPSVLVLASIALLWSVFLLVCEVIADLRAARKRGL